MPDPITAMVGGSLGSAVVGASSANRAAKAQTAAANADIAFQTETRDIVRGDLEPFRGAGTNALAAYNFNMGLGERPEGYVDFTGTPGYQFRFDQGTDAVNAMAGARGGLQSGRTMQDLTRFGQGIASDEYGNYMNRLGGLIDTGMSAAQMSGAASQNAAAGVSNALSNRGNAQAAGAIGVGNAITGGIQNGIGLWQYQQGLQQPRANAFNPATGGGNWWMGTR